MKHLVISNIRYNCHYEIIESIIIKYREFFNLNIEDKLEIYLYLKLNRKTAPIINYIEHKYSNIIIVWKNKNIFYSNHKSINIVDIIKKIKNPYYYIDCSIYDRQRGCGTLKSQKIDSNIHSKKKYITHNCTNETKQNNNIYYLTPFAGKNYFKANILPYANKKRKSDIPIYVIQGNIEKSRRNYNLLSKILQNNYKYKFIIKLIGRGSLPSMLSKYKKKIIVKNNLNFKDYHKEFLDAYCILPLITKKSHPQYYKNKLTSTINYKEGYDLKCLIDKDLQKIYKLDNVEIFNDINDIALAFKKTLNDFYVNK